MRAKNVSSHEAQYEPDSIFLMRFFSNLALFCCATGRAVGCTSGTFWSFPRMAQNSESPMELKAKKILTHWTRSSEQVGVKYQRLRNVGAEYKVPFTFSLQLWCPKYESMAVVGELAFRVYCSCTDDSVTIRGVSAILVRTLINACTSKCSLEAEP